MNVNNFDAVSEAIDDVLKQMVSDNNEQENALEHLRTEQESFESNYVNQIKIHKALLDEKKELQSALHEMTQSKKKLEALYENIYHSYSVLSNTQEAILTHNRLLHNLVFNELRFWN